MMEKTVTYNVQMESEKFKIGRGLRVYVAGPVNGSGRQHENLRRALEVAQFLRTRGFVPFVPHLSWNWHLLFPERTEPEILDWCASWVRACNFVVRLPGESPGSDFECNVVAKDAGIRVFQNDGNIGDYLTPARLLIEYVKRELSHSDIAPMTPDINVNYGELNVFQASVTEWLKRQPFYPQQPHQPLLGIGEELGELMHAHLKCEQKIRGSSAEHLEAKKDAIGDILVYMAGYCEATGLKLGDCLERAWEEVRQRDWNKNRETGAPVTQPSAYSAKESDDGA